MQTPICTDCGLGMRCVKTGRYIVTFTDEPDRDGNLTRQPYQIWAGDEFECDGCGYAVVTGFASRPISERGDADFAGTLERLRPMEVVL